jgi:branched-chain amino acid transport system permease protein
VSVPTLRLSEEYFLIATFAYQVIATGIMNNWTAVTRGPLGIHGIPKPFDLADHYFTLVVACAAAATLVIVRRVVRSPFGRVLHALREDEVLCRALGKRVVRFKVTVFVISAAVAAAAGALFAWYAAYVEPNDFTITESILILSMVIIGGAGTIYGPFTGAALLVILAELLRFVGLPAAAAANLRQMLYGTVMVGMLIVRPRGLLGRWGPAR